MGQFDVYRSTQPNSNHRMPYLLDIQHDFLSSLNTRVVAPLVKADYFGAPVARLNPVFEIEGLDVVMSAQELAGVGVATLGVLVCSLSDRRDDIVSALDFLIVGF